MACHTAVAGTYEVPLDSLQLNGTAQTLSSGVVRLTSAPGQASAAFTRTSYALRPTDDFEAFFAYKSQAPDGPGVIAADGLAFVAQSLGSAYLGFSGSGLGFFTQSAIPAIGITFDYYPNAITGSPAGSAAIANPIGINLTQTVPAIPVLSGPSAYRCVWIFYSSSSKTVDVYYSDGPVRPSSPILSTALVMDLSTLFNGQVFFGVTAGTGQYYAIQNLLHMAVRVGPRLRWLPGTVSPMSVFSPAQGRSFDQRQF